mmetsp:Transcript_750/g.2493  ORF Transcript_750/g.2493 Transcript_750/m.2493 type:complete len:518 (-) Transcript_750:33-1586(-)
MGCQHSQHSYTPTQRIHITPKKEADVLNMSLGAESSPKTKLAHTQKLQFNSLMKLPSTKLIEPRKIFTSKAPLCHQVMQAKHPQSEGQAMVSICASYAAYRKQLIKHIRGARSSVVVCFQALQDKKIWSALKRKSKKVHVEVLFMWSDLEELNGVACDGSWEEVTHGESASMSPSVQKSHSRHDFQASSVAACGPTTEIVVSNSTTSLTWMDSIAQPGMSASSTFSSLDSEHIVPNGSLMMKRILWETNTRCLSCNFIVVDDSTVLVSSSDMSPAEWKTPMCGVVIRGDDMVASLYRRFYNKIDDFSLDYEGFTTFMKQKGAIDLQYNSSTMQIRFFPLDYQKLWDNSLFAQALGRVKDHVSRTYAAGSTYALYINSCAMDTSTWSSDLVSILSSITRVGESNGNAFQCKAKFKYSTSFPRFTSVKTGVVTNCHNYSFLHRAHGLCESLFSTVSLDGFSQASVCSNQILFREINKTQTPSPNALQALLPGSAVAHKNRSIVNDWPIHHAFMQLYEGC